MIIIIIVIFIPSISYIDLIHNNNNSSSLIISKELVGCARDEIIAFTTNRVVWTFFIV